MGRHPKSLEDHIADGTYRADRHGADFTPHVDDEQVYALLARWEAAFDAAASDVEANGMTITTEAGRVMMNPAARHMATASTEIRMLHQALGIGPRNRRSIGIVENESEWEDDLDAPPRKLGRGGWDLPGLPPLPERKQQSGG